MKRIYPHRLHDCARLSALLGCYLDVLADSPLHVNLTRISVDTDIPVAVLQRLRDCRQQVPSQDSEVTATDFHILFANLLFRYPTVKIWEENQDFIFEV